MIRKAARTSASWLLLLGIFFSNAHAAEKPALGSSTGLPVPRFATLKSDNINARKGPGPNYPVQIVFKRKALPVEIIAEFKDWRQISDIEGDEGWVHKAMLSGNRSVIANDKALLVKSPQSGQPVAEIEKDAQSHLVECQQHYCLIEAGGIKGWVEKTKLWGVYEHENFD